MKKLLLVPIIFVIACSTGEEKSENRPEQWHGVWNAEWETPPEAYPGIEDMEFYMDGKFTFTSDSLTKTVYGYPGCIFAIDTLSHTQSWYVSNDTLFLVNDKESPGMTYKIAAQEKGRIRLQLLEDIFVTLTK